MININGLQEEVTIKELLKMEESLKSFPELKQIKKVMEAKNKQVKSREEKTQDLFNELGVKYYE